MKHIAFGLLLWCFSGWVIAATPTLLIGMEIRPAPTLTRFTFTLNKKAYGHVKYLLNPDRVELELMDTVNQFDLHDTTLRGANVTSIVARKAAGNLRFTFLLRGSSDYTIHFTPTAVEGGAQVELSIFPVKQTAQSSKKKIVPRKQMGDRRLPPVVTLP